MKYIYVGADANITKKSLDIFTESNHLKVVKDEAMLDKLLVSRFSTGYFVIGKGDTKVIAKLLNNKLVRRVNVITKDMELVSTLGMSIPKLHILDYTLEDMPSYWLSPITDFENMVNLANLNLRAVRYDFTPKEKGFMTFVDIIKEDVNTVKVNYISIKEMKTSASIVYTKSIISEESKKTKALVKDNNHDIKDRVGTGTARELKIDNKDLSTSNIKIEDYLVNNGYITKERLKKELKTKPNVVPIEQYLCTQKYYSKEDLVSILSNFLNQIVYGKEDFRKLKIEYTAVKQTLKDMGVIEAYKLEDTELANRILIVSYDSDRKLLATINGTISYQSLVFTLPDYLEEYM